MMLLFFFLLVDSPFTDSNASSGYFSPVNSKWLRANIRFLYTLSESLIDQAAKRQTNVDIMTGLELAIQNLAQVLSAGCWLHNEAGGSSRKGIARFHVACAVRNDRTFYTRHSPQETKEKATSPGGSGLIETGLRENKKLDEIVLSCSIRAMLGKKISQERQSDMPKACLRKKKLQNIIWIVTQQ